jgi:hypothetical protein
MLDFGDQMLQGEGAAFRHQYKERLITKAHLPQTEAKVQSQ